MSSAVMLPADIPAYRVISTDVVDELTRVIPSQTSAFTVGASQIKLKIEIPNAKTVRMNQMILEFDIQAGFTSTDVGDVWADVEPTFVPLIASVIDRWTLWFGSVMFCDNHQNDLRWNLQYWLRSNAISRLNDLYIYPEGLAPAEGKTVKVRFPLVCDPADFGHAPSGVLPFGILPKASLDLFFSPAAKCMYAGATADGTVTFNYTISNVQLIFEETSSSQIAASISSGGIGFSYMEWYHQQIPLAANTQSISVQIANNFRWVHHIVAVIRKVTDETVVLTAGANKLKYFSSDLTEVKSANIRFLSKLRYDEPLIGSLALVHEMKKILPYTEKCDYFQDVTTNGTTHSVYVIRLGASISPDRESGVDCSSSTTPANLEMTWTSAITNASHLDIFICHTRFVNIAANGVIRIDE